MPVQIAIDGHSSCGKSTLARRLAKQLGYLYIDTGAMYRAVTWYFLSHTIAITDQQAVRDALSSITLRLIQSAEGMRISLNGQDISDAIRSMEVSQAVSSVAAIPQVRTFLVAQQQAIGNEQNVVMDGRDIGTVVFPHAALKIFLTASLQVRAYRRWKELEGKGEHYTMQEVVDNLSHRDTIDSTRDVAPLIQAADAVLLDNSDLDADETLKTALRLVETAINR